jgi:hypothetical protein
VNAGLIVAGIAIGGMLAAALPALRSKNPASHTATVIVIAILWTIIITALIIWRN